MERVTQIIRGHIWSRVRPESLEELLPIKTMIGRECQQLDELGSFSASPDDRRFVSCGYLKAV